MIFFPAHSSLKEKIALADRKSVLALINVSKIGFIRMIEVDKALDIKFLRMRKSCFYGVKQLTEFNNKLMLYVEERYQA